MSGHPICMHILNVFSVHEVYHWNVLFSFELRYDNVRIEILKYKFNIEIEIEVCAHSNDLD